jgi:hypothetical protein
MPRPASAWVALRCRPGAGRQRRPIQRPLAGKHRVVVLRKNVTALDKTVNNNKDEDVGMKKQHGKSG